jgi:hypothetical protein
MSKITAPSPHAGSPVADPGRQIDRTRVEQEIRTRFADQLARADICASLRIESRIRAEIAEALAGCDIPVA